MVAYAAVLAGAFAVGGISDKSRIAVHDHGNDCS
jgi:hypothetical protein